MSNWEPRGAARGVGKHGLRSAHPNARDESGVSVLDVAVHAQRSNIAGKLLERGAVRDPYAAAGRLDDARVLPASGATQTAASIAGGAPAPGTPLHRAAAAGQARMITLLFEHGADVNAPVEEQSVPTPFGDFALGGEGALHLAAQRGDVASVRVLLARGAAVDGIDAWGWTPLWNAVSFGREGAARALFDGGAAVNGRHSAAPLLHAAYGGYPRVVALLLDRGANIAARSPPGASALHRAVEFPDGGADRAASGCGRATGAEAGRVASRTGRERKCTGRVWKNAVSPGCRARVARAHGAAPRAWGRCDREGWSRSYADGLGKRPRFGRAHSGHAPSGTALANG